MPQWMKKTHSFPPDVLFLSLQDIAIHLPFGDNSNLFETETDPAVFSNGGGGTRDRISVTRCGNDFTGRWLGGCSLIRSLYSTTHTASLKRLSRAGFG